MDTHRVYIASGWGSVNVVRGGRQNKAGKRALRRSVKKVARRYDATVFATDNGSRRIANL